MDIEKLFSTIDTHVAGEVFRIVIQSSMVLKEGDILANQDVLQKNYQNEKSFLLNEPRGHRGVNGCIVINSDEADYAVLFFNHESESQFKYGGLVTTLTALLETGNLSKKVDNRYKIETVQGVYTVDALIDNNEVVSVSFNSNHCQLIEQTNDHCLVEVDGLRNYYIYPLPQSIPGLHLDYLASIMRCGKEITRKLRDDKVPFTGIIITEHVDALQDNEVRSVTFKQDGHIERSPGFDTTFALHTKELCDKQLSRLTNYSLYNSVLTSHLINDGSDCFFEMEAQGFVTGMLQFIYDQDDPLKDGFLLC